MRRTRDRGGRRVPSADERDDLTSIHHGDPAQYLATVEGHEGDGWIRTDGVSDALEDLVDFRPERRVSPLQEGDNCVADGRAQGSVGHRISLTVATSTPAIAPAKPFFRASFASRREKNELGLGVFGKDIGRPFS